MKLSRACLLRIVAFNWTHLAARRECCYYVNKHRLWLLEAPAICRLVLQRWLVFVAALQGYDAFRAIKNYHSKTFIMETSVNAVTFLGTLFEKARCPLMGAATQY